MRFFWLVFFAAGIVAGAVSSWNEWQGEVPVYRWADSGNVIVRKDDNLDLFRQTMAGNWSMATALTLAGAAGFVLSLARVKSGISLGRDQEGLT